MSMTPADLRNTRFAKVRKGYDADEVDGVVERAAAALEALVHERHELLERIRQLEAQTERYREFESTLSQTLELAERAADEIKADAHAEVQRMMDEARAQVAPSPIAVAGATPGSALPDPAFIELLGETRAIRSLLQTLLTTAPPGEGGSPFTPRAL